MALLIYKTMIRPHLGHGDFIIDSVNGGKIAKLEHLQERAVSLVKYCPVKEDEEFNAM